MMPWPWYAWALIALVGVAMLFCVFTTIDIALDLRMSDWIVEKYDQIRDKTKKKSKTSGIDYSWSSTKPASLQGLYSMNTSYSSGGYSFIFSTTSEVVTSMPEIDDNDESVSIQNSSEFAGKDVEFGIGYVMGTRSFRVTPDGILTGVSFPRPWEPGVNTAECLASDSSIYPVISKLRAYSSFLTTSEYSREYLMTGTMLRNEYTEEINECNRRLNTMLDRAREFRNTKHSLDDCAHGFYAYYEGSNDYYADGMVMGVVKGSGELVLGTRGFKAEKAEIVALYIPDEVGYKTGNRVAENYADIPQFSSFQAMIEAFPPTGDID